MDETTPRNVRVPDEMWQDFNKNVGVRGKSVWLREFMESVNRDPQLWKEFRALAELRGDGTPGAMLKAIQRYNAER